MTRWPPLHEECVTLRLGVDATGTVDDLTPLVEVIDADTALDGRVERNPQGARRSTAGRAA
ncbi:MAG TPA: hypothetical protein VHF51_15760 [Solirubrobacteraceae bacterium]|nr:hypothetical protein [Solirubrobacteraceae bacterium]